MKHLFIFTLLSCLISIPLSAHAACWSSEEISRIDVFSELDETIILSFKDAVDCKPIDKLTVSLGEQTFSSDERGFLTLPIEAFEEIDDEDLFIKVTRKGYIPLKTNLRVRLGTVIDKRFLMSKDLPINNVRFVLQWGDLPQDLDLHLLAKDWHISFRDKKNVPKKARLDKDALRGYGPETITMERIDSGAEYTLYVDNFSVGDDINNEAIVYVYANNRLEKVVRLPDTMKRAVKILEIKNGQISYINRPVKRVK